MDAKIGNFVVTPRNGKVVEINSLWYNALKTMEYLAKKFGEKELADTYKKVAKSHQKVFEEKLNTVLGIVKEVKLASPQHIQLLIQHRLQAKQFGKQQRKSC